MKSKKNKSKLKKVDHQNQAIVYTKISNEYLRLNKNIAQT